MLHLSAAWQGFSIYGYRELNLYFAYFYRKQFFSHCLLLVSLSLGKLLWAVYETSLKNLNETSSMHCEITLCWGLRNIYSLSDTYHRNHAGCHRPSFACFRASNTKKAITSCDSHTVKKLQSCIMIKQGSLNHLMLAPSSRSAPSTLFPAPILKTWRATLYSVTFGICTSKCVGK